MSNRASIAMVLLVALALPGCLSPGEGAVFGPAGAGDDGDGSGSSDEVGWPITFKAKPARGPVPLLVAFDLQVAGAPTNLPWKVDFGDGSTAARDQGQDASFAHTYQEVGEHVVTVTVGPGGNTARSTLTITALPPGTPVEDDEEEVEGTPLSGDEDEGSPDSEGAGGGPDDGSHNGDDDGNHEGDDEQSPSNPSSSSTPTASSPSPTSSSQPSPSTSSSAGATSSPPSPSSSSSPSPSSNPSPSTSASSSPSPTSSQRPSPTSSPSPSSGPPPNQMPVTSIDADPYGGQAPADVTYTITASDPDGDALTWTFTIEGVQVGSGTEGDSPWSHTKTYTQPGYYSAVLTATDGDYTVRREITIRVYDGPL